jgi:hypothetical protein
VRRQDKGELERGGGMKRKILVAGEQPGSAQARYPTDSTSDQCRQSETPQSHGMISRRYRIQDRPDSLCGQERYATAD